MSGSGSSGRVNEVRYSAAPNVIGLGGARCGGGVRTWEMLKIASEAVVSYPRDHEAHRVRRAARDQVGNSNGQTREGRRR
ncbi:hypothetical protein EVAR_17443_1 [Eumeta japonica]|uniref:Uncharacterized protein n=1 Tax=Eumeta variegata TaxID=151549 RepID=A0A4C1V9W1_EUMVA|nr:hypothetical protein EVAR_17443_1 [Eumeta japonica]